MTLDRELIDFLQQSTDGGSQRPSHKACEEANVPGSAQSSRSSKKGGSIFDLPLLKRILEFFWEFFFASILFFFVPRFVSPFFFLILVCFVLIFYDFYF